jgi:glutamate synthase (NADPH/NADH) small chain
MLPTADALCRCRFSGFDLPLSVAIIAISTSANPIVQSTTPGLSTNKRGYIQASEETQRTRRRPQRCQVNS